MLVFNLVPAFPLDGGRIAHAAIWWRTGDRNRATHATGRAGQGFALLLGALGLWALATGAARSACARIVLAFFLYQAAGAAVVQGALGRRIQNITVADIMDREPVTIPAGATLLDAHEQFFLRYRWPWFAVVDPARHFLGVVRAAARRRGDLRGAPGAAGRRRARAGHAGADRRGRAAGIAARRGGPRAPRRDGRGRSATGSCSGVVTLAEVRRALRAGDLSVTRPRRSSVIESAGAATAPSHVADLREPCQHTTY